jgi:hypothetical protein
MLKHPIFFNNNLTLNAFTQDLMCSDTAYDVYEQLEEEALARLRDVEDMSDCTTEEDD